MGRLQAADPAAAAVSAARTWRPTGPCPFLTCLETGPHEHPVCPDCEAVRYGNPFYCATCNAVLNAEQAAHGLQPWPLSEDPR
jgi:predicted amidophosphoribosyltransferase